MNRFVSKKLTVFSFAVILAVLGAFPGIALDIDTQALHLKITSLDRASAPEVWQDYIIFTYNAPERTRSVSIAFEYQDYRQIHTYQKNDKGIFFLAYPIPQGITELTYRIIVDGLWMHDKTCPSTVQDSAGIRQSRITIPKPSEFLTTTPRIKGRDVEFLLQEAPGKKIFVAGNFNRWDPFMHALRETSPGVYRLTLRLLPGRYYYRFVVEGKEITNPLNYEQAYDINGTALSTFEVAGNQRVSQGRN